MAGKGKIVKNLQSVPLKMTLDVSKNGKWSVSIMATSAFKSSLPKDEHINLRPHLFVTKKFYADKHKALDYFARYERHLAVYMAAKALRI